MPTILFKRSSTPSAVPTTSNLALGEIGINTYDGRLFTKKDSGTPTIVEVGLPRYQWLPGQYTPPGISTGASPTAESITFIPVLVYESLTTEKIGCKVTTAVFGSYSELAIYNGANGAPTSLLLNAGSVSTGTTGTKTITIDQAITPGLYFLAILMHNTGVAYTSMAAGYFPLGSAPSTLDSTIYAYTKSTSSFPDPATSLSLIATHPWPCCFAKRAL